jgi:hypothetical protein
VSLEKREKWKELCELAAVEQDPEKLMELVCQITDLLEAREHRLKTEATSARSDDSRSSVESGAGSDFAES